MSDRLKLPPERDFGFYRRRKHDKWSRVPSPNPALESAVADSHAHLHMLPDPAWELARCAVNGVDFVCAITDPSEDGKRVFDEFDSWSVQAMGSLEDGGFHVPQMRIAVGVHPHNAKLYDHSIEQTLVELLEDTRVSALGEVGLDYHYDLSPRDAQRRAFRRQIGLAKDRRMPLALHVRSGEDSSNDDAHAEVFSILQEEGFPAELTLLHCCALPPDRLKPWIEAGCYIAYGGAVTFKNADAAREGARLVPGDRLLFETDTPYMAPEPMRGAACTPAHVVFTAERLADVRGIAVGEDRRAFLQQVHANTLSFYHVKRES